MVGLFGFDYNGWMAQRHNCSWHDGTKAGWYKDTIQCYKGITQWYDGTKSQYHDGVEDNKEDNKELQTDTTIKEWKQGTVSMITMRMKRTRIIVVTITRKY